MPISPQITQAFDECLDAVIGLTAWPQALQRLGASFGADSAVLMPARQDFTRRRRRQIESTEHAGFSDLWLSRLEDPFDDPHSIRSRRFSIDRFPCVTDDQIVSAGERATSLYFNEIARPGNREWWALLRAKTDGTAWCLNLYRGNHAGPYGAEEALRVGQAAPLLRRLASAAEQFDLAGWDARLQSLDQLNLAAFLVDSTARVVRMTPAAEAIASTGFDPRRPATWPDPGAKAAMIGFLGQIAAAKVAPEPILLARAEGGCWLVEFIPVVGQSLDLFSGVRGMILVSDIAEPRGIRPGVLRNAFGLTRAEEQFALTFLESPGLEPAAKQLGIGRETARSHLRALFDKTGARSQTQLSVLLTRTAERMRQTRPPNG